MVTRSAHGTHPCSPETLVADSRSTAQAVAQRVTTR
jgi:hypothetical protein